MRELRSQNPATGEVVATFAPHDEAAIDAALQRARSIQRHWAGEALDARAAVLRALADHLRRESDRLGHIITTEMGKPSREAVAEVEKCATVCDYYADGAAELLAAQPYPSSGHGTYLARRPLGTVLAIMPWNYPFWQVVRCAAPALVAGNALMLKHASNVPRCALALEEAFLAAGAPEGLFRSLLIGGAAAEKVVGDPRIASVTLTGSERAGARVAAAAGKALKKTVLELGGSDPFIVLDDADVAAAAETAVKARFQNAGQSCIAAKRFIVDRAVGDAFTEAFCAGVTALRVGDPTTEVDMGPLAREDLRETLRDQIARAQAGGARVAARGDGDEEPQGWFAAPVVLHESDRRSPLMREEVFGPAAPVFTVDGEDEAVEVANDTEYGLGASVWTEDVDRGEAVAARIESGQVFVNGMVASDPRVPFGGIKRSGYGRELADLGLYELVNLQTVWKR